MPTSTLAKLRAVAAGVATPMVPRTRQHPSAWSGSGSVNVVKVHPWAWSVALILARGNAGRIEVQSATVVIVRNRRP